MDDVSLIITGFISYIVLLVLTGVLANKYGRSVIGWIIFGLFLSPVLSVIFLLSIGKTESVKNKEYEKFATILLNKLDNRVKAIPKEPMNATKHDNNTTLSTLTINDLYKKNWENSNK
ncbi:MAG: hypothetical protein J6X10_02640 [Bacteroidales bacterium]|nr:hypothetical protein [Bacteroidales bacterium]